MTNPSGLSAGTNTISDLRNNLPNEVDSHLNIFAGDAKIVKGVRSNRECETLQGDLDKLQQ